MSEDLQKLGEDVVEVLCQIYDPEIPVNIYELGLIYDVLKELEVLRIKESKR